MRHVVYADTLVLLNAVVTFLLLSSVRQFAGVKTSHRRLIAASFLGGVVSCVLLLPKMGVLLSLAVQIASGALIAFCAFFEGNGKRFIRCWALFAGMTFCYGGVIYGASLVFPGFVRYRNGYGYLRIGFWGVIAVLTAAYLLILLLKRRFGRGEERFSYEITLTHNGTAVTGRAVFDSGHFVTDCYTGKPVVIVSDAFLSKLMTDTEYQQLFAFGQGSETKETGTVKPRLIPVTTVNGTRLLTAFTCDRATVKNGDRYAAFDNVTVAAAGKDFSGLSCDALIGRHFFE